VEVIINQKSVSVTDEYEIFVGDKLSFNAISEAFKTSAKINVYDSENNNMVLRIAKRNFGIRANYLIEDLRNIQIFSFEEINNIKLILKCQVGENLFQLYGHNGNKYSIFKNQKQVGYWEKNNLIFGEKDSYRIIANDNEDALLLSAFCICIDNSKNNFQNELSFFNFDIGFKGNLFRKFDEDWKPNE
jgi:uncharacterized protein YxjI